MNAFCIKNKNCLQYGVRICTFALDSVYLTLHTAHPLLTAQQYIEECLEKVLVIYICLFFVFVDTHIEKFLR